MHPLYMNNSLGEKEKNFDWIGITEQLKQPKEKAEAIRSNW
jgi:hypothetical protein